MRARVPRSPVREIIGVLIGLAVGLILVAALHPFHSAAPAAGSGTSTQAGTVVPAGVGDSAAARSKAGAGDGTTEAEAPIGAVPSALDAEWAASSAESTCADWAGGDGISAVRLNSSQVAWFFSDTYLGPAGPVLGFSHSAGLVHNSVVVQTTSSSGSRFATLTGGNTCSYTKPPTSVVAPPQAPGRQSTRYWAEGGLKVGSTVVEFYNRYSPGNIPYVPLGTVMTVYSASSLAAAGRHPSQDAVASPSIIPLPYYLPHGAASPIVWGAAVLRRGNTVYVYGTGMPSAQPLDRQLYVARVPVPELTDFSAWQFYAGAGRWGGAQQDARPVEPAGSTLGVSTGFSVVQAGHRYWLIQADPIAGSQDIDAFPAASPWGPFDASAELVLYNDPSIGLDAAHDYRLMYEARAETAVSPGGALIISYNINSTGITAGCTPMSWFDSTVTVPRFVSVPLSTLASARTPAAPQPTAEQGLTGATGSTGGSGSAGGTGLSDGAALIAVGVTAGPPVYPTVASQDPSQWFDEWDYPSLCPPIPGLSTATATTQAGSVTLTWPDVGQGLAYLVYLRGLGARDYVLKHTVPWVLAVPDGSVTTTLSGLRPGKYQAKVVPMNLTLKKGQAAVVTFTVPSPHGRR
jgi:hypothetical protein